ncbi:lysophospholipase [Terriglobus roseus DSM 18391]|uniref:Lysophospholipase n=1 Tax=Terriglobus roseus (strain DSM 18391 / NRRL B-41598 / KBS 63) TaxID=926566 RepID=I3ZGA8_TERRK|nr:alpha/beta hydrolase [Terriglobus roseus]AFL88276.1 lysophospholipase [Terriglobus roseus DSM 18391]AFL88617.1 lysophospholipase [Terriglobus roseus DSM 18391]
MAQQPKTSPKSQPRATSSRPAQSSPPKTVEVVDPRWLVRMLGVFIVLGLFCSYLALGLLFYMGSWQLVLHPTRLANGGTRLVSEKIHFGPNGAGEPQLAGEWIGVPGSSSRANFAALYLRGGDGQLDAADGTQIAMLRDLGLNVLAFDYRGYGNSAQRPHPSEDRMQADAVSAWEYLTSTRHIAPDHVILFGSGTGVSLAVKLLQNYGPGGGLIAYNADPTVRARVAHDPRSHLFPLSLVFHDNFSLEGLKHVTTPKLLYTVGQADGARKAVYQTAADPKLTVEVPTHDEAAEKAALTRFLDSNLPGASIPVLTPQVPSAK